MIESEFQNRVAVVTGASSGIGKATALRFAEAGASVLLVARRADRLEEVALRIRSTTSRQALPFTVDVSEDHAAAAIVQAAAERFGQVDILVNAAGILVGGSIESTSAAAWDATMNVNLRAVFNLMAAATPCLHRNQRKHRQRVQRNRSAGVS